jgi:hypothetical protein
MTWCRILFLLLYALWQGGFMFYGAVVVPVGAHVLGSETEQGFVTQEVTQWLNACGAVALAGWLGILLAEQRRARVSRSSVILWCGLLVSLLVLVIVHERMDKLLDAETHSVLEPEPFYAHHRVYLIVSTLQWLGAIGLLCLTIRQWSRANGPAELVT